MTQPIWTQAQADRLARDWKAGIPTAQIGKNVGMSKFSVVGKAHRMGLPARPSPIKRRLAPDGPPIAIQPKPHPLAPGAKTLPPLPSLAGVL
jgi:GcrA cell cycle regulator